MYCRIFNMLRRFFFIISVSPSLFVLELKGPHFLINGN